MFSTGFVLGPVWARVARHFVYDINRDGLNLVSKGGSGWLYSMTQALSLFEFGMDTSCVMMRCRSDFGLL